MNQTDGFVQRHLGPSPSDQALMLERLGCQNLEELLQQCVPAAILLSPEEALGGLPEGCPEGEALADLQKLASDNKLLRSLIGLGYYSCPTPALLQRHVFENPAWYTAYTPYQAEIAQGRLEALLNFQTLISELTGLPIANASLLDEATAAAEAMALARGVSNRPESKRFHVQADLFPQTLAVLQTRAEPLAIELVLEDPAEMEFSSDSFGLLLQLPGASGACPNPGAVIARAKAAGALVIAVVDPLAQVLMEPVANLGVDIAVGSAQRFGVPLGFGGPHAAFFACSETYKRQIPGRLVGVSKDKEGNPALRLALQTREQHIRRDKATSNICTAQVLLAVLAGFYAVHHGPAGLRAQAQQVQRLTAALAKGLSQLGFELVAEPSFDTLRLVVADPASWIARAEAAGFNFLELANGLGISLDACSDEKELEQLLNLFAAGLGLAAPPLASLFEACPPGVGGIGPRLKPWLQQEVFQCYRSETELLRYIQRLVAKDFSLVHGMIPLGSCTMKLNGAAELLPVSWPAFSAMHPFAPADQYRGYSRLIADLEQWLALLTGFAAVSLQPNAGSQGEYAGLLVIRAWHRSRGEGHRRVCLIPTSAHGTNPASAVMAGMQVVAVQCDSNGNIDRQDLAAKAAEHSNQLAALMVTYPSTHGVFEEGITEICSLVHGHGGQVYLDGANLNAQVGVCKPGGFGADVCHLNLHKTFCIPHGGGGPGVGPIAVAAHLAPYLPGHPLVSCGGSQAIGAVAAAPWGSASILPISWMYIRMMGGAGLRQATAVALLAANDLAERLDPHYPVLYRGANGRVAHECILDLRPLKNSAGLEVDDLAKRLMDYGFHAPTVSWPVAGTVMVEPTESESLKELDRFVEAMVAIRAEVAAIETGQSDPQNNPLKRAPHTQAALTADQWDRPYSRQQAAFPVAGLKTNKLWPAVARIDNAYGDRNLVCSCPSVQELESG
ncbi:aminomethyl-transferring glycine dehydrogenase [Synechococcus lacustris C3-12m-Tous]|uniref:aminomethyl-transferring glycine dehydrogenase n=1 Tax=Synechococcus lacustris TaxID=2116544 RepID=UPI0020CBE5CB|nr:aminomethyl-transferring glycine dehydrogenase [Synechococcus lacustris]MCP9923630.1 aminomethyl-transferring glycine dehydrogenase [Synechococcus lacustris C3-12m-Tous]